MKREMAIAYLQSESCWRLSLVKSTPEHKVNIYIGKP